MKFIYKKGTELYVADTLSPAYTNERVISNLTYCRSPQSHLHVWLKSKGTMSLILLCKKWHISLLMGGQKSPRVYPQK